MRTIIRRAALVLLLLLGAFLALPLAQTITSRFVNVVASGTVTTGGEILTTGANIRAGAALNAFNTRVSVSDSSLADAPGFFQAGEPGVSAANVVLSNNYYGINGGSSGRVNTANGGSYLRLGRAAIDLVLISSGGALTTAQSWSASGSSGGTYTSPLLVPDGSVSAPGFGFSGASNTGIYRPLAGQIGFAHNGVLAATLSKDSSGGFEFSPRAGAFGTGGVTGSYVSIGHNSSGAGAAGFVELADRSGATRSLWVNSGLLRIGTGRPTENDATSHTGGSVVGDQTSSLDTKDLLGTPTTTEMLDAVLRTRVHRFRYKDGRYGGEVFTGIVTDEAPWFGKDRDAAHPAGKALNEINGLGYTIGAIQALAARVRTLEAELARLTPPGHK